MKREDKEFMLEDHPEIEEFLKSYGVEDLILGSDEKGEWICASELIYKYHQEQLAIKPVVEIDKIIAELKAEGWWLDNHFYRNNRDFLEAFAKRLKEVL
jgi:hypothetical protein